MRTHGAIDVYAPSAATRVLPCNELLRMICEWLSPGSPESDATAQTALARLARVCRAFSQPALAVLWRVLDSLLHLLKVLPSFVRPFGSEIYTLSRPVTDQEWERFTNYAKLVRELYTDVPRSLPATIHPSVWTFLAQRVVPDQGLLPRLVRLEALNLDLGVPFPETGHMLLLSPSLTRLAIHLNTASEDNLDDAASDDVDERDEWNPADRLTLRTVLQYAQQRLRPRLEWLRVRVTPLGRRPDEDAVFVANGLTFDMNKLRVLDIADASLTIDTHDKLQKLMELPHLIELTLRLQSQQWHKHFLRTGFRTLRALRVHTDPATFRTFMELPFPNLRDLSVAFTSLRSATVDEGTSDVQAALARMPETVTRLRLFWPYHPDSPKFLFPALQRSALTVVHITADYVGQSLQINDASLAEMANAWPELVELEIKIRRRIAEVVMEKGEADITERALAAFATRTSRLRLLGLPFLGLSPEVRTNGGRVLSLAHIPVLNHRLERLHVSLKDSKRAGSMSLQLAMVIDRLFPYVQLDSEDWHMAPQLELREDASELECFLLALRSGREGRHRAAAVSSCENA